MRLKEIYDRLYGQAEKTASQEDEVISAIVGEDDDEKAVKLAAAYDELGRELARQTFAEEVLGGKGEEVEKTAAELVSEILEEPEKTAEEDPILALLQEIEGENVEKTAQEDSDLDLLIDAFTKEGEDKTAGKRRLLQTAIKALKGGGEKAKAWGKSVIKRVGKMKGKKEIVIGAGAGAGVGGLLGAYLGAKGKKKK